MPHGEKKRGYSELVPEKAERKRTQETNNLIITRRKYQQKRRGRPRTAREFSKFKGTASP